MISNESNGGQSEQAFDRQQEFLETADPSPGEFFQYLLTTVEKESFLDRFGQVTLSLWYELGLMAEEKLVTDFGWTDERIRAAKQLYDGQSLLEIVTPTKIVQGGADLRVNEWLEYLGWQKQASGQTDDSSGSELTREAIRQNIIDRGLFPEQAELPNSELGMGLEKMVHQGSIAGQYLVMTVMRSVLKIARKFCDPRQRDVFEELVQVGNLAVVSAVGRYEFWRRVMFNTYAFWVARDQIKKFFYNDSREIQLSNERVGDLGKLRRCQAELRYLNGQEPTIAQLAQALNWKADKVHKLLTIPLLTISLDGPKDGNDSRTWSEVIEDDNTVDPEEKLDAWFLHQSLVQALTSAEIDLSVKERIVLGLFLELAAQGCDQDQMMHQIAEQMGVCYERVRQIKKAIRNKLLKDPQISATIDDLGLLPRKRKLKLVVCADEW